MAPERRVTVRGIIFKDGTLFAQKLKHGKGERDYWCIPGGGLDPGESLVNGLTREMIEETGIAPKIGKLLYVQQYADASKEFLEFFFHIKNPADYHTIDLANTTHGLVEVARCEFIAPSQHHILPLFLQSADIEKAIHEDGPTIVTTYLPDSPS